MYTEYNSQNVNQNYNPSYLNNNDGGKDTKVNKVMNFIWKIILVLLVLILLFLALIQFGVISLTSDISPDTIVLNVNEIGIKKGRGYQLVTTVLPENASNKQVVYESSDPKVVSVNEVSGYVKGLKVGTATVKVKTLINDKETECLVTVEDDNVEMQSISLNDKNISVAVGYTYALSYRITPSNATEVGAVFYSSDPSVATVDSKGNVKGIREGSAVITISANNNTLTDTANVTVYKKGATTTTTEGEIVTTKNYPLNISLSSSTLNLTKGSTGQLKATITPSNANSTLTWKSSNSSVATVNENGLVTAVGIGTADIVVQTINNKTASCKVTVGNYSVKVESIDILSGYSRVSVGETRVLYAQIKPENATNRTVSWTSSNPSVVSVDSSGVVKALKSGSAIITATSKDGGKTDTVTIDVFGTGTVYEVKSISFAKTSYEVGLNSTRSLGSEITYEPSNATYKSVSYTSSNTNVAKVESNGKVWGVGLGTAKIIATTKQGGVSAETTITVKEIPSTSVSLKNTQVTLIVGATTKIEPTVNPTNASNKTVTFMSNNPNVATVAKDGTVTAVGSGTAVITVTPNGGGSSSTCMVTVR